MMQLRKGSHRWLQWRAQPPPPNPLKVRVMMEEMEAVDELVNSAEELKPSHLISAVCMFLSIIIRFSVI